MLSENDIKSMLKLDQVIQKSPYVDLTTEQATAAIVQAFNQGKKYRSIMTSGAAFIFQHRLIEPSQFRLVHYNNEPELVAYTPQPLRRHKIFNFTDTSATLGIYDQSQPLIGANGRYVINVPPGQFAKVYDGNRALLLDSGQHVIRSNRFKFDPNTDLVDQRQAYIKHNDLHILRVPPGKLAAVTIDNKSYFLESREEPYVFRTLQLTLLKSEEGNQRNNFHDANTKELYVGSLLRLLPDVGEVGVINNGGRLSIVKTNSGVQKPIIRDSSSSRFVGFLSTNLQNVDFPSENVRAQHLLRGESEADAVYDYFYTGDMVKVGVKFYVGYRIFDPELTLKTLTLNDIQRHIESVVNTDMGNAIQQTSIKNLLSSNLSKPYEPPLSQRNEQVHSVQFNHWQDVVKSQLSDDLKDYGIELVRLNIEESKILDAEIEQSMSQQAITVAKAAAESSALEANLKIKQAKAEQERDLDMIKQDAKNQVSISKAKAHVQSAEIEAQAKKIEGSVDIDLQKQKGKVDLGLQQQKGQLDIELQQQRAKVELTIQQKRAALLADSPETAQLEIVKAVGDAVKGAKLQSGMPLSDFNQMVTSALANMVESTPTVKDKPGVFSDNRNVLFQPSNEQDPTRILESIPLQYKG